MNRRVAVLVGWHEHPVSGRPVRNAGDAVALAVALGTHANRELQLLGAGAMPEDVARDYLALGASSIELLQPEAAVHDIVPLLAPAIQACALVLTGTRSDGGLRSGTLPFALAARLQRPVIADVVALQEIEGAWLVTQALPRGARRRLRVSVPAVLAIHPSASVAVRHSYRDRQAGQVLRHVVHVPACEASPWQLVPASLQLQRLRARRPQSGHARMQAAIGSDAPASAAVVLREGSADDKARAIFDHLRAHSLLSLGPP